MLKRVAGAETAIPNCVFLVPWHFGSCFTTETGTYRAGFHQAAPPSDFKHKP